MDGNIEYYWPASRPGRDQFGDQVLLRASGLSLFRAKAGARSTDLEMSSGENWVMFGPAGSGRTRFFELLSGLTVQAQGDVHILGRNLADWSTRVLRRQIAWVHTQPAFLTTNVRRELVELRTLYGFEGCPGAALALLEQIAPWLQERLGLHPADLDPDERLALDVIRRIHAGAALILLDEMPEQAPPQRVQALYNRLISYCEMAGLTTVLAARNPFNLMIPTLRGAFLWGGEIRSTGVLESLRTRDRPYELVRYMTDLGIRSYVP